MDIRPLPGLLSLRGRRIGLLGGSFNPAHAGHRHISVEALRRLDLHEVWWLVSPQNPLKPQTDMATLEVRLRRAEAIASHPRIRVTALEAKLGTQYTVDTLSALRLRLPATQFVWVMGADNLLQLSTWRRWTRITATVPIAVFARQSYDFKALAGAAAHRLARFRLPDRAARLLPGCPPPVWAFLLLRRHPASATMLRRAQREAGWLSPAPDKPTERVRSQS